MEWAAQGKDLIIMSTTTGVTPSSIYFVNSDLSDIDALIAALPDQAKVVMLDREANGLQQMLDALEGVQDLDSIQLLTHGEPGALMIGGQLVDSHVLADNAGLLAEIGSHLSENGDILLYGCDLAADAEGREFVSSLSKLSGADVAASTDLTGSGGDWDLEYHVGEVEAFSLSSFALSNYDGTLALPGAHSATQGSEVFLGGNYIELGISSVGSFGTSGSKPSGFYGTSGSSAVGMSNDADGFNTGSDLRIDYFLPGTPEERWAVGYNGSTTGSYSALNGNTGATLSGTSVTNSSSGSTLTATFAGTVGSALDVEQVHTFGADDKFFKTTVTLTNTTGSAMTDVRFMRSFDPDNTKYLGGAYSTNNEVVNTFAAGDGKAVVSATSNAGDSYNSTAGSTAKILFFSSDDRAYGSNFGFKNTNPYSAPEQAKGYSTSSDSAIAITFKLGTLAAGASVSFEYFTSLDTADINDTITAIEAASNPPPTFTSFAAPIDSVDEDNQVEITFAELAAQGNEADQQPDDNGGLEAGTVDAFVVTSVTSGTLLIGTDAGSASEWNPGTNDVIDSTHKAYWTPDTDANGTLNAFKVVARDTDGLKSSSAVTAQVTVNAINDAPGFTTAASLNAVSEDIADGDNGGQSVDAVFAPRFQDVDGTFAGVVIVGNSADAGTEGAWQYSTDGGTNWYDIGVVSTATGLVLDDTALLRFVPVANYNGTPGGLVAHAVDNQFAGSFTAGNTRQTVDTDNDAADSGISTAGVGVSISVSAVNDLPTFTSAAGAASLTETAGWDNSVTTASGALTGTLTGTDQEDVTEDSGSVSFTIRGGATAGNIVTKQGFFGTLTLDTSTNAWTYTPGNFIAINALAQGATATDSFEFKVYDSDGGSAIQTLDITLTGTNDLPVLASALTDQTFSGAGSWSYQVPSDSFTDAEGLGLTYTAELVTDGTGTTLVGDGSLPAGLAFDEGTRTFSGDPSSDGTYFIRVTATDSEGATVNDVFQLDFTDVGNQPPVVSNPVIRYGADTREFKVTFGASGATEEIIFDGVTVAVDSLIAADVATAVAGETYPNYTAAVDGGDPTSVIFIPTQSAATDNRVQASDFTGSYVDNGGSISASFTNGHAWFYDLPTNVFTDPENDALTYKAYWVAGDGSTTEITAGSGGDAILSFDPATLKFTGDGTALPSNLIRVEATDAGGSNTSVTSDFALYLSNGVDDAVNVTSPIPDQTWDGAGAHSYRIPPETFHFDDLQNWTFTLSATLDDDSPLPGWLSFDATTGTFSGNPPHDAPASLAIKVSAYGETVPNTVTDTFTLNLTNTNDAPVVSTTLGDQTSSGSAGWSLNVGTLFTDPDGNADGTSTTSGIDYTAELTDGSALPSWLSFDGTTFSGNPPAGVPYLNIRVIGTDPGGDTTSTTFTLDLGDGTDGAAEVNTLGSITISDVNGATLDLGDTVTAAAPTDADGYTPADVTYQWQVSSDGGTTWLDIDGETGQSYVTTQAVSGKDIRVQAFYNDDGGFAEAPVSNVLAVPTYDVTGSVTIAGALAPGQTVNAVLTDNNGLTTATPTYTWYRGDNPGDKTTVVGGNYSAYTLVNDDGGKYITVEVSYTDDEGTAEVVSDSTDSAIQLGVVAPVATDDTANAVEASGLDNTVAGTNPTGNVLDNDTDPNDPQAREVTSVRSGNVEGIGSTAFYDGSNYIINGQYGTLTLAKDGSYSYAVSQYNYSVEALAPGDSLVDSFNYSVTDDTGLSDVGVLNVTIDGANDAPSVRDVPTEFNVSEDVQSYLSFPAPFSMDDPDSPALETFTVVLTVSQGKLWGDAGAGIAVTNSGTSALTLTGSLSDLNSYFDSDNISYLASKPHLNKNDADGAVELTMTLEDGDGNTIDLTPSSPIDIIIAPVNDAPTGAPTIQGLAADDRMVTVSTSAIADIDGLGHMAYVWYLDGVEVTDRPTNSAILLTQADVGKRLSVEAVYTDVDGTVERVRSVENPVVGNLNDDPTGGVSISGTPQQGEVLTASNDLADDDGMGDVSYQWLRNGEVIEGATGETYTLTQADVGADISVKGSYTDAQGTAESATSSAVTVTNRNDAPSGTVSITGAPEEDQVLTASNDLADVDGMGPVSYQWLRNGEAIDGATGETYSLSQADVGSEISVQGSYTDGFGAAESATSDAVEIANVNDLPTGDVVIEGTANDGQTLTVTHTLDDEDGMGEVTYQWLSNGEIIEGATADSYALTQADVGAEISVRASYTDAYGTDESVTSDIVEVINANDEPQGTVSITGTPSEGETLTASNDLSDVDGLGEITYQWLRDGEIIEGATGETYLLTQDDVDAEISVQASYVDGQGTEESVTSDVLTINNVNDEPTGGVAISGTPTEDEILTASNDLADADGMGEVSYQWLRDGEVVEGATGESYLLTQADVGTEISVQATYVDGQGTEESATSAALMVANVNDEPVGTVVISGTASEGAVLTASNDLSDEDGMGEVSYQWLRNGELIDGATGETYTLTQADVDQVISVEASYTDALGTPESVSSDGLSINNINDLPQGDVTISGTPSDGETLTASNDLTDADGMGEVTYQWLRNGEVIEGATGSTYLLTQDDVGADISVRASYTDGQGTPESVDSNAVAIGNTNDLPTGGVTISGTPAEGETLTASNDLADEDGMGDVTYQWLRDGEVIEGATGSTYQLGESDIGAEISVIASYTDGQGTEESATSNTLLIANVNDEPTGGVTISGTPSEGETLTASNDLDDADGMGDVTYQWLRDGQVIDGATGATYDLGSDDIGTEISVVASYTDGQDTLESVGSDALTVAGVNSAPEGAVTLSGFPVEGETLTASNTLSDADGMGEVTYQWLRDGEVIEGASGETYVVGAGDFGSEISVVALYTDGEGNEESVAGDAIEITGSFNQAPVFDTTATLSVDEDDVLEGTLLATDPDGDDLTFTLVDGPANGSITLSDSGAYVYTPDQDYNGSDSFVAQVSDGNGGETQATFTIGVSPVEDEPEVVGGAPDQIRTRLGQTSTVDLAGIFEDVDGDLLTYSYTIDPAGDLPEWITFNDDGSVIFTAPTEATNERVTLTLTAVDESGNSVSHDLEFVAIRVLTVDGMEVEQDASLNRTDLDIQPVPADRVEDPETENVTLADIPLFSPENPDQSETLVSIPQGVGISARSGNGPVSRDQAIGDLITYIKETTAEDDADRDELIGGGESFLGNLPDTENLMVSRITLTAGDQTPSEPIRITSRTNNADEGESATIPEAFVIDVRDLPSGTVIDLDGIEFAVIVGDATVTGGNGRNIVYGNEQNQIIVLGEDDDELYGGSGDDTVGSKGGDDKVFGEAGNDIVFGGSGADLVHGGLDEDVATFEGNRDDYTILFNNASVTVVNNSDESDSDLVVNAETLRFADQDISVAFDPVTETFAWLYGSILDRQADLGGIEFYVDRYLSEGIDLGGIALEMLRSQEFTDLNEGVAFDQIGTVEDTVETLYEHLHGRASDSEGFSFWVSQLESGMSVEAVIDEFMTSQEMQVNGFINDTGWSFLM
ncbi:MAG: hypothetical protein CMI01_15240 [Oceanospirillaceae bacterium]|nr:hypothetical protein [Oceanospirillaceae bacterium]